MLNTEKENSKCKMPGAETTIRKYFTERKFGMYSYCTTERKKVQNVKRL